MTGEQVSCQGLRADLGLQAEVERWSEGELRVERFVGREATGGGRSGMKGTLGRKDVGSGLCWGFSEYLQPPGLLNQKQTSKPSAPMAKLKVPTTRLAMTCNLHLLAPRAAARPAANLICSMRDRRGSALWFPRRMWRLPGSSSSCLSKRLVTVCREVRHTAAVKSLVDPDDWRLLIPTAPESRCNAINRTAGQPLPLY